MIQFLIFIIFGIATISINHNWIKPPVEVSKQESMKNFNNNFLKTMSIGNKRVVSDLLWIQTMLDSDIEHYSKKDLNNWMLLRFLSIVSLDPFFIEAYRVGGQYLSVVKDDKLGAKLIYDLGLSYYPNDFLLNWNSGFHYYFELKQDADALVMFKKILHHPKAPPYLPSIVAKLESKNGDKQTALAILEESLKFVTTKPILREKFLKGIRSLKIQMDLECLNSGKQDCNLWKPDGYYYIKGQNGYITNKPFETFKLSK